MGKKGSGKKHPQAKQRFEKNNSKWFSGDVGAELRAIGLRIREVAADGNCFFRALSDQLTGHEHTHADLRHQVVEYIRANEAIFSPFIEDDEDFDEYCDRMSQDAEWAGHIEVQAASLVLESNLKIYQAGQPVWSVVNFPTSQKPTLHLSYHDQQHYNSVRQASDPGDGPALPIETINTETASHEQDKNKSQPKEKLIQQALKSSGTEDRQKAIDCLIKFGGDLGKAIEYLAEQQAEYTEENQTPVAADDPIAEAQNIDQTHCIDNHTNLAAENFDDSSHKLSKTEDHNSPPEQHPENAEDDNKERVLVELKWKTPKQRKVKVVLHLVTGGNTTLEQILSEQQQTSANKDVLQRQGGKKGKKKDGASNVGRNQPCPCGSRKKYKQCCGTRTRNVDVGSRNGVQGDTNNNVNKASVQLKELII